MSPLLSFGKRSLLAVIGLCMFVPVASVGARMNTEFAHPFSCGPHFDTYIATSSLFSYGNGIRCVKWSDGANSAKHIPVFAWYGEGRWETVRYRHVGQAFISPGLTQPRTYQGFATDLYGNGETVQGDYRGGLVMTIVDADTIEVTGGWQETWKRVSVADYIPLPMPTTCGQYFDQYRVESINDYTKKLSHSVSGSGIRCVMRSGAPNTTWFGMGEWGGKRYMHLVTGSTKGYGSSDFCQRPEDYCGATGYGDIRLRLTSRWQHPVVDGWNEIWIKVHRAKK